MKTIATTNGYTIFVDDEDYPDLSKRKWFARKSAGRTWYATSKLEGRRHSPNISMHRVVMNYPKGLEVDHINGNGLDNRKENLRICTHLQNGMNQKSRGGSSLYKGVYWHKQNLNWVAYLHHLGKRLHLGSFDSEVEAAKRHDEAARKLNKEFGRYNFPLAGEQPAFSTVAHGDTQ